jgi:hypothetical protein
MQLIGCFFEQHDGAKLELLKEANDQVIMFGCGSICRCVEMKVVFNVNDVFGNIIVELSLSCIPNFMFYSSNKGDLASMDIFAYNP